MSTCRALFLGEHHLVQSAFYKKENNHAKQANAFKAAGGDAAGRPVLPALGQRDSVYQSGLSLFRRVRRRHGDADSLRRLPLLSGGLSDDSVRKRCAKVARVSEEDELGQRGEALSGADDHSIRVLLHRRGAHGEREGRDHSGASGVYVDFDCLFHLPHGADERAQVDRRADRRGGRGRRQLDEGRLWRRGAPDRRGIRHHFDGRLGVQHGADQEIRPV